MGSFRKSLVIALSFFLFLGFVAAYTGSGSTGDGTVDGEDPYCQFEVDGGDCDKDPSNWDNPPECSDGVDNNGLWGADYNVDPNKGDPGCSSPYDDSESFTWDTDLTATVNQLTPGESPTVSEDPTIYFKGEIRGGGEGRVINGHDTDLSMPDSSGSGSLVERHLGTANSEQGSGEYSASGFSSSGRNVVFDSRIDVFDNLPEGVVVTNDGRAVDTPVNPSIISSGSVVGGLSAAVTCGDGYQNEGHESYSTVDQDNDDTSVLFSEMGCESDYGVVDERKDWSPAYDSGEYWDSYESRSCPSDDREGDTMYEARGDQIIEHDWERTGRSECDCTTDDEGRTSCSSSVNYGPDSSVEYNCNSQNTWNGGGFGDATHYGNDPAATFTDMTAYGDSSDSEVWCQFDEVTTVDADGPRGYSDGFVVIDTTKTGDDRIIGRKSPEVDGRTDWVGKRAHVRRNDGSLERINRDFLTELEGSGWEAECDGTSNYCVKYVDFYTTPGTGWTNAGDAVRVREMEVQWGKTAMTPDMSYSVCKFINEVGASGDRELIDCDYEATKAGEEGDMSPLDEACGDEDDERLIMAEGKQVNFYVLSKELYQSQSCVKYGNNPAAQKDMAGVDKPGSDGVRTLTDNGCVMAGAAYAEGTVKDASQYGNGVERSSSSPDLEVCLDADIDVADRVKWDNNRNQQNQNQPTDVGGEWYDLDDQEVQEYIRNNFDRYDYNDTLARVESFMRENPNPQHDDYNPTGGEVGLTLEDNCGNERFADHPDMQNFGCSDEVSPSGVENLFYTFFDLVWH